MKLLMMSEQNIQTLHGTYHSDIIMTSHYKSLSIFKDIPHQRNLVGSSPLPPFGETLQLILYLPLRCACQYRDNNPRNPIIVLASGTGTSEEIKAYIADDNIVYGFVKVVSCL